MRRLCGLALTVLLLVLLGRPAHAQSASTLSDSPFARDRNVSVTDRPHPELDPLGIELGTLIAMPSLTTSITYDDNIYAQQTGGRSDGIVTIGPALSITSNWPRNAVGVDASLTRNQYLSIGSESSTDYGVDAHGKLDIERGSLSGTFAADSLTQARTDIDAPDSSRYPIRYHDVSADVSAQREFGDIRILASLDWHRFRYENTTSFAGAPLDQTYRNRDTLTGEGRIDYALTPAISVYVDGALNRRSYSNDLVSFGRDSHGYTVEGGADFDITRLVRGHLQFGYLSQTARDSTWNAKGFSGRGKVEWFTTPVLTVTLEGGRSIQDSALSESPAYKSTDFSLRADYELLRSVILTAKAGTESDRFEAIGDHARQVTVTGAAHYRMGRHVVFDLSFLRVEQHTPAASILRRFSDNRATFSVRLQI